METLVGKGLEELGNGLAHLSSVCDPAFQDLCVHFYFVSQCLPFWEVLTDFRQVFSVTLACAVHRNNQVVRVFLRALAAQTNGYGHGIPIPFKQVASN